MKKCNKVKHRTKEGAAIAARLISKVVMNVYFCNSCKAWHCGNTNDPARRANRITELLRRHKRMLEEKSNA